MRAAPEFSWGGGVYVMTRWARKWEIWLQLRLEREPRILARSGSERRLVGTERCGSKWRESGDLGEVPKQMWWEQKRERAGSTGGYEPERSTRDRDSGRWQEWRAAAAEEEGRSLDRDW